MEKPAPAAESLSKDALSAFDFIDLGASEGGSIRFAQERLGGGRALAIDIDPHKVARIRAAGLDCIQGDATALRLPPGSVRFAVLSHFLEHLPDRDAVRRAIVSAAEVATDFLFIRGPCFDADDYLAGLGLKFFYSDWVGHRCHLTSGDLVDSLHGAGLHHYKLLLVGPTANAQDPFLHPLSSPPDQHKYDPTRHAKKPAVEFGRPVFKGIVVFVRLRPFNAWPTLLHAVETAFPPPVFYPTLPGGSAGARPTEPALSQVCNRLLSARGGALMRHVHLRAAFAACDGIRTFMSVGEGSALPELALAVEFPDVQFLAARWDPCSLAEDEAAPTPAPPNFRLEKLPSGAWPGDRYDFVAAVDASRLGGGLEPVAERARSLARLWAFLLESRFRPRSEPQPSLRWSRPFGRISRPAEEAVEAAWWSDLAAAGDVRTGVTRFCPGLVRAQGCLWEDRGARLSRQLEALEATAIVAARDKWLAAAQSDLLVKPGESLGRANGFWALAYAGA